MKIEDLGGNVDPGMHIPKTISDSIDKHILGYLSSSAIKRRMVRFDDPILMLTERIEDYIWVRRRGITLRP